VRRSPPGRSHRTPVSRSLPVPQLSLPAPPVTRPLGVVPDIPPCSRAPTCATSRSLETGSAYVPPLIAGPSTTRAAATDRYWGPRRSCHRPPQQAWQVTLARTRTCSRITSLSGRPCRPAGERERVKWPRLGRGVCMNRQTESRHRPPVSTPYHAGPATGRSGVTGLAGEPANVRTTVFRDSGFSTSSARPRRGPRRPPTGLAHRPPRKNLDALRVRATFSSGRLPRGRRLRGAVFQHDRSLNFDYVKKVTHTISAASTPSPSRPPARASGRSTTGRCGGLSRQPYFGKYTRGKFSAEQRPRTGCADC